MRRACLLIVGVSAALTTAACGGPQNMLAPGGPAARTLADTPYPSDGPARAEASPTDPQQQKRLATLREFVITGYKTKPLASV